MFPVLNPVIYFQGFQRPVRIWHFEKARHLLLSAGYSQIMICCFYCAGAHCMDILPATIGDPDWVVLQRNIEIEIINGWILKYYQDLLENSS
jgi:hypothetical protein